MANVAGNPFKVDTASATAFLTTQVKVRGIRWVGATTAGHTVVLTDAAGVEKWASVANAANYVESDTPSFSCLGLAAPTLASGILYIEIG